ncbi:TerD family protein [Succinimonas amylolytica]|uniref:TerD family protein n=1 Tax=Succinimonas amylolytica TaxID=83769 RepID=UPI0023A8A4F4
MSVKLQKGQKVSLTKTSAGLSKVIVGLGWDEAPRQSSGGGGFLSSLFSGGSGGSSIDCDAFALLLSDGKLQGKSDVVYFGNLEHKSGSVKHMGDNLTGAGEGDDEQIVINLDSVPAQYDRILMGVNIYSAQSRKQHFGMIRNAFIRLVDARTSQEMCIFNLTEDYSGMTAMVFGEVYRHNGEWKFNAIGQGTTDGSINEFIKRYA